jgi:spermidine synthase
VKPFAVLARALSPDGTVIQLTRRDDEYVILAGGQHLMSSRMHASEESLAAFGCRHIATASTPAAKHSPSILIGGLGMGYTLRAALDLLPSNATILIAELIPEIVDWNRGPLAHLAAHPLDDPRIRIEIADVAATLRTRAAQRPQKFDAILLDVDNGPGAFTDSANAALYSTSGIAAAHAALNPGGILALWSAREDRKFERRLRAANFTTKLERTRAHANNKGPSHTIYLAQKSQSP